MRNLKKVLALVLTLAMMLSVMVMNVGAFTDDKDIQHKEAAKVVNAIGVLKGYEDGSYGPANILTRAEAATICARLLEGPEKADTLKTTEKPFNDVEVPDWFSGYVAYCKSEKIINGVGNNNFAPEETLTIAQFSKILLCALGYDAEAEGMTGSAWSINTAKLAQKNDLLDEIDTAFDADCNRDDAAQMILNLLKADMVEYDNAGTTVTTSDGTTVTVNGSKAEKMENTGSTDGNIDQDDGDGIMQFAEKYFEDLELNEDGDSDFGRPANTVWTNDGDEVYSEGNTSDLKATFVGQTKKVDLYKAVGSTAFKDYELKVFFDGKEQSSPDKADFMAKSGTTKIADFVDGMTVEVYVDKDAELITICAYAEYLAQATDDYDDEDENVPVDVFDTDLFTVRVGNELATATLDLDDFDNITEIADEDYLVVTISYDGTSDFEIVTVAPAETANGELSSYSSKTSAPASATATIDGTAYQISMAIDDNEFDPTDMKVKDVYDVYLDSNGNILGYELEEGSDNYVFVTDFYQTSNSTKSPAVADAYFTDGTNQEITLKSITPVGAPKETDNQVMGAWVNKNFWFTYTVGDDGKYALKEVTTDKTNTDVQLAIEAKANFVTGGTLKANNDTVFLIQDDDDDVTAYTGYKNLPDVNENTSKTISYYYTVDKGFVEYIFIDADDAKIGGSSSSSSDLLFVFGSSKSTGTNTNEDPYTTLSDVLVNGEEAEISFLDDDEGLFFDDGGNVVCGLYTDVTYDEDGYVTEAELITAEDYDFNADEDDFSYKMYTEAVAETAVTFAGGVLNIGNDAYALADGCTIYTGIGGDWDTTTARSLDKNGVEAGSAIFGVKDADGDFTALYILK